ncbi:MAG: hypothetical protein SH859_11750, partial [Hyphomicrobium aestuarii]|nr:hypothetical protein [Hyphomicrobium aestuarii]
PAPCARSSMAPAAAAASAQFTQRWPELKGEACAAGAIVVTDEADGATRIFLDGLSWRGVPDRPIVT